MELRVVEGENPVHTPEFRADGRVSKSRVVWDCSTKREVSFFQS